MSAKKMQLRGVSPLISGTLFVLITVIIATLVAGWLGVLSEQRTSELRNITDERLRCEYADLFISTLNFDCNANCFTGVPYSLNGVVQNSGTVGISFSKANIIMKDGQIHVLNTILNTVAAGASETVFFDDILIRANPQIPVSLINLPNIVDDETRALWHFDEAQDNFTDDATSNNNDASLNATWVLGNAGFGFALDFDGEKNRANASHSSGLNLENNLTLEAWILPRPSQNNRTGIICKGLRDDEAFCFSVLEDKLNFFVRDSFGIKYDLNSSTVVAAGVWQHVAATFNSTTLRIYLNKSLVGESEAAGFSGTLNPNLDDVVIGNAENETTSDYKFGFNGSIDEVRISNITRTFSPVELITSINLTYNISHSSIQAVRVYNAASGLIDVETNLGGIPSFNKTIVNIPIDQYRVEVEDVNGNKIEKWYPSPPATPFACQQQSILDKITIISTVCPNIAFDAIPEADINFVNCV